MKNGLDLITLNMVLKSLMKNSNIFMKIFFLKEKHFKTQRNIKSVINFVLQL